MWIGSKFNFYRYFFLTKSLQVVTLNGLNIPILLTSKQKFRAYRTHLVSDIGTSYIQSGHCNL